MNPISAPRPFTQRLRQRGAAAIEFAFVLPILVALLYGIVTFGDLFYTQMAVTRAASDAARAVSSMSKTSDTTARQTKANSVAQDSLRITYPTLPAGGITVVLNDPKCPVGDGALQASIRVTFPYTGMLPAINLPGVGTLGWGENRPLIGCAVAQL